MWCLRCGEQEPGQKAHCKTCDFELGLPEQRGGYFAQVMKMTDRVLRDEISIREYERAINIAVNAMDDLSVKLEPVEIKLKELGLDELDVPVVSRPIKYFREGIMTFREGLEKLRDYVHEKNLVSLSLGLPLLKKANNMFLNAANTNQYIIRDVSKELESSSKEDIEKYIDDNLGNA
jgi:hypothetical protein